MNGLTTQERLRDIQSRCGLSEDIIRRVLSAETASAAASLKKGERVTLMGRCVMHPKMTTRLEIGGQVVAKVKVAVAVASSLEATMAQMQDFEESSIESEQPNGIRLNQIASLA